LFQTTQPEFYKLYLNARKVRDTGSRKNTSAIISGMVKGIEGALESALVELLELEFIDSTEANGNYTFGDIPTGTYTLRISHPNYKTQELKLTVAAKEELERNVVMVK
jgi:hypothetical protein